MSTDPSLHRMTASQLAAGLRKKAFSATELCEAHIDRIERLDGQVNAVVVRDFDRARAEARQADVAMSRGEYLERLDWSARQVALGMRGKMPESLLDLVPQEPNELA